MHPDKLPNWIFEYRNNSQDEPIPLSYQVVLLKPKSSIPILEMIRKLDSFYIILSWGRPFVTIYLKMDTKSTTWTRLDTEILIYAPNPVTHFFFTMSTKIQSCKYKSSETPKEKTKYAKGTNKYKWKKVNSKCVNQHNNQHKK